MLVVSRLTEIIRSDYGKYDNNTFDNIVIKLFNISFKQLSLKDIEGEVKKAALKAATSCLARFGDKLLLKEIKSTLNVLNERLSNEITRETALECFTILAKSPLKIDISGVINKLIEESGEFLKKKSSSLRNTTATTLTCIISVSSSSTKINDKLLLNLIKQCSEYINDQDLHLCALILSLLSQIVNKSIEIDKKGNTLKCIISDIFPCCYKFLQSPLLQGNALESLKLLFSSFYINTQGKLLSFDVLKNELIKSAQPKLSRSSYSAIAQCLSSLILSDKNESSKKSILELVK